MSSLSAKSFLQLTQDDFDIFFEEHLDIDKLVFDKITDIAFLTKSKNNIEKHVSFKSDSLFRKAFPEIFAQHKKNQVKHSRKKYQKDQEKSGEHVLKALETHLEKKYFGIIFSFCFPDDSYDIDIFIYNEKDQYPALWTKREEALRIIAEIIVFFGKQENDAQFLEFAMNPEDVFPLSDRFRLQDVNEDFREAFFFLGLKSNYMDVRGKELGIDQQRVPKIRLNVILLKKSAGIY